MILKIFSKYFNKLNLLFINKLLNINKMLMANQLTDIKANYNLYPLNYFQLKYNFSKLTDLESTFSYQGFNWK